MNRWLFVGAVNGFLAVAAGAFATHGLETRGDARALHIFETGAHYHLTHALALIAVALLPKGPATKLAGLAGWLFATGIVLFSGSLYFLVLAGSDALVLATPLGGLAFLAGWLTLAYAALKSA